MKLRTTVIILCLFTVNLFSQDTIIMRDKKVIIAKITSETSYEVEYREGDSFLGKKIVLRRADVEYIGLKTKGRAVVKSKPSVDKDSINALVRTNKHRICVSLNLLPLFYNERSIFIDYCYISQHSLGMSIGQIYANPWFYDNRLSADQSLHPGAVYNGVVFRFNYKYYFSYDHNQYLGLEYYYKKISYDNFTFTDATYGSTSQDKFVRTENASVKGFNFLYGYHLAPIESMIDIEFYGGVGFRHKYRSYFTIENVIPDYEYYPQPLGAFEVKRNYPILFVGFKIGIDRWFK